MNKTDYLIALLITAAVGLVTALLLYPGLTPVAWQGFAEAARVRPPEEPFPGVWRFLASFLMAGAGVGRAIGILRLGGAVAVGFLAGLFYLSVREALPIFLRYSKRRPLWKSRIERMVVLLATIGFAFSAPMNTIAQAFTADTMHLLLTFVALWMVFRFSRSGNVKWICGGMFLCGILAAEAPIGILLIVFYVLFLVFWPHTDASLSKGFAGWDPVVVECVKWKLTSSLFTGFGLAIWADIWSFAEFGGVTDGLTPLLWAEKWTVSMGQQFARVATVGGWFMFVGFGAAAVAVAWKLLPRATTDERLMSYGDGLAFLGLGLFSLSQLSGLDSVRYVNWFTADGVGYSPVMCAFASLFAALVLVTALAALAVEVFCRNSAAILRNQFPETMRLPVLTDLVRKTRWAMRRYRRVVAWTMPLLVLACVLPARLSPTDRRVYGAISEYLTLVLDEAKGLECLFTDGHFDCALELFATARGEPIVAHSLFGNTTPHRQRLRLRTARDVEDEAVAEVSASAMLKNWVEERTNRLDGAGFQVGYEMWRRKRQEVPPAGGTMVRTAWPDGELAAKGAARAKDLGRRMHEIYRHGFSCGKETAEIFDEVAWRLTRVARLRSQAADRTHDLVHARDEQKFADTLDTANPSVARMKEAIGRGQAETSTMLSPREGLRVALARPDFRMARQFALPILHTDPDDPNANFATGMAYLLEEQWTRAEEHLKCALKRRPEEPAVFNNLAALYYKVGKYKEAEKWAKKAAALLPDSPEVRETLRTIRGKTM